MPGRHHERRGEEPLEPPTGATVVERRSGPRGTELTENDAETRVAPMLVAAMARQEAALHTNANPQPALREDFSDLAPTRVRPDGHARPTVRSARVAAGPSWRIPALALGTALLAVVAFV